MEKTSMILYNKEKDFSKKPLRCNRDIKDFCVEIYVVPMEYQQHAIHAVSVAKQDVELLKAVFREPYVLPEVKSYVNKVLILS